MGISRRQNSSLFARTRRGRDPSGESGAEGRDDLHDFADPLLIRYTDDGPYIHDVRFLQPEPGPSVHGQAWGDGAAGLRARGPSQLPGRGGLPSRAVLHLAIRRGKVWYWHSWELLGG